MKAGAGPRADRDFWRTYVLAYLRTYLLHGAESFLRS